MALKIEVGDVFNELAVKDDAGEGVIFVHGCNAQGVMGSGVAAIVKKLYPDSFTFYQECYARGRGRKALALRPGHTLMWEGEDTKVVIAHAITQEFYGKDGRQYVSYDAVIECLEDVRKKAKADNLPVYLPMIGGGLGGGDVKRLTAIFQAVFHDVDATLWLLKE
jgi:O-acetyl-ADP-ribose deacetylase (regulator of RNase III)